MNARILNGESLTGAIKGVSKTHKADPQALKYALIV
jgi:hypothetical protein